MSTPEHDAQKGHAKNNKRPGRRAGLPAFHGGKPRKLKGLSTMTTEILSLAAQFQLWVNQLVARHLEAEATRFVR